MGNWAYINQDRVVTQTIVADKIKSSSATIV